MGRFCLMIGVILLHLSPALGNTEPVTCAKDPCLNDGTCKEDAQKVFESCECVSDWAGTFCQMPNTCKVSNPCKNGGQCLMGNTGYYCKCPKDFNGVNCEYEPCKQNPCQNSGVCTASAVANRVNCECTGGWMGATCGVKLIEMCKPNPCQHGGNCTQPTGKNTYGCACPAGWMGANCTIVNMCHSQSPCVNNGTCCPNRQGYPICKCPPTHMGPGCKEELRCPSACTTNGGQCGQKLAHCYGHSYYNSTWSCKCPPEKTGTLCQAENPCAPGRNPCHGGGCKPSVSPPDTGTNATYTCSCPRHYRGRHCEFHFAGVCCLWGDPHYITLDNQAYDNMDTCRQTVLKTCSNNWPVNIIPTFQIWVENRKGSMFGPSVFHRVGFDIYGYEISISLSGGLEVTFPNGTKIKPDLPWPQEDSILAENFPLSISFDPANPLRTIRVVYRGHDEPYDAPGHSMEIYVDSNLCIYISHKLAEQLRHLGRLCGMCGNFDNKPHNDYSAAAQAQYLVKPYIPDQCYAMTTMLRRRRRRAAQEGVQVNATCTTPEARKTAEEKCNLINDKQGPFADCIPKNPVHAKMFEACVFDVCYNESFLESNLAMYASVCSQYGKIKPWREQAGFKYKCPKDMDYNYCGHRLCTPTCRNTKPCANDFWKDRCDESCECKEGTIWDHISNRCVDPSKCNKTDFGRPSGYEGPVPGPWNVSKSGTAKPPMVFQCCQKNQFNLTNQITCQFNRHCFLEGAELILGRCKRVCTCKSCGKMKCKNIKKSGCKHHRKCLKCYKQGCFNDEDEAGGDDVDCSTYTFYDALKKHKTKCCTDCAQKGGKEGVKGEE